MADTQNFNPNSARFISENDSGVTVFDPAGNVSTIPKNGTDPATLDAARNLPKHEGFSAFDTGVQTQPDLSQQTAPASAPEAPQPPPVAPMNRVPAGPQMASQTAMTESKQTEGHVTPQKFQDAVFKRGEAVAKLQESVANKEAAAQENMAKELTNRNLALEQQNRDAAANERWRQAEMKARRDKIDAVTEQYANNKIEPDYFARMDTGQKIATAIALTIGGYAAGLQGPGAKNIPLEMLDKAADRDIEAQKANLNKQGEVVRQTRGAYADYLSQAGDERTAELAEKNRILGIYASKLEQMAATSKVPVVQQQGQLQAAETRQKMAENDAAMNTHIEKNTTEAQQQQAPRVLKEAPEQAQKMILNAQEQLQIVGDLKKLAGMEDASIGTIEGRIGDLRTAAGASSATDAVLRGKLAELIVMKATAEAGGRPSEEVIRHIEESVPKPSQNPAAFLRLLKESEVFATRRVENLQKGYQGQAILPSVDNVESNPSYFKPLAKPRK